jgi:hypothetical protein
MGKMMFWAKRGGKSTLQERLAIKVTLLVRSSLTAPTLLRGVSETSSLAGLAITCWACETSSLALLDSLC